jgi:hypothetical protein
MHGHGKSDDPVVPAKLPDRPAVVGVEVVRGRGSVGGTRPVKHASDAVLGWVCRRVWFACVLWRAVMGGCGSPRFCIT